MASRYEWIELALKYKVVSTVILTLAGASSFGLYGNLDKADTIEKLTQVTVHIDAQEDHTHPHTHAAAIRRITELEGNH